MKHRPPSKDPLELLPRALTKLYSLWVSRSYPFASIGRNVSFHITSRISRPRSSRISLGNSVSLKEYAWLSVATEDPIGEPTIVLGDNCHIGFGSIISAKNRICLEQDVLVGQVAVIVDHNHAYEDVTVPVIDQGITEGGTIRIGQGTWIGHGASIICPRGELTIGRNCVIAANSMVMRSIPDYSVAAGYPATVIRQYDPERQAWRPGGREGKVAQNTESTMPFRPEVQATI
jgi:acetyltransferase-like isoleucine patch superfamily enzyme